MIPSGVHLAVQLSACALCPPCVASILTPKVMQRLMQLPAKRRCREARVRVRLLIYARCPYCCCQETSRGTDLESHKSSSTPPSLVDISVLFECSPVVDYRCLILRFCVINVQIFHLHLMRLSQRLLPDNVRHGPRSSHASAPLARWIPIFTPFSLRSLIAPMMNPTSNPLQC